MNAYELISSDLAARLGLKRLTLAILATSLLCNTFLSAALLLKKDVVSTVLVPVGINEVTHPVTVAQAHIDEEYLALVTRDILSLALNITPVNVDHNRLLLLKHAAPSAFGEIDEMLKRQANEMKRLHASSFFSIESMDINPNQLTVKANGIRQHFIGKTETLRQKATITVKFSLVAGRLHLLSLSDSEPNDQSISNSDSSL